MSAPSRQVHLIFTGGSEDTKLVSELEQLFPALLQSSRVPGDRGLSVPVDGSSSQ